MKATAALAFVFVLVAAPALAPALAQGVRPPQPRGTAVVVRKEVLDSMVQSTAGSAVSDQPVRMVDVGSYQVGAGIVHRSPTGAQGAIEHSKISEVYYMMEGAGVLVTGGTIPDGRAAAPESPVVTVLNGPSTMGSSIAGGESRRVAAGDVVIIPPNTPHFWSRLEGKIVYLVVRVDPEKVIRTK